MTSDARSPCLAPCMLTRPAKLPTVSGPDAARCWMRPSHSVTCVQGRFMDQHAHQQASPCADACPRCLPWPGGMLCA